jgi:hypothetical protein
VKTTSRPRSKRNRWRRGKFSLRWTQAPRENISRGIAFSLLGPVSIANVNIKALRGTGLEAEAAQAAGAAAWFLRPRQCHRLPHRGRPYDGQWVHSFFASGSGSNSAVASGSAAASGRNSGSALFGFPSGSS